MKNIVFDLGGVVFARDPRKCDADLIDFFSFVRAEKMPKFWEEYDRGTLSLEEVIRTLSEVKECEECVAADYVAQAIRCQEEIVPTKELIRDLKQRGYRLYVLSNMSCEFIEFLRQMPVYHYFDGEVVSCEERVVKPEAAIYRLLLERYALDPAQTLFIDDRPANLAAAAKFGITTFLFHHSEPEQSCAELRTMLL